MERCLAADLGVDEEVAVATTMKQIFECLVVSPQLGLPGSSGRVAAAARPILLEWRTPRQLNSCSREFACCCRH